MTFLAWVFLFEEREKAVIPHSQKQQKFSKKKKKSFFFLLFQKKRNVLPHVGNMTSTDFRKREKLTTYSNYTVF